MFEFIRQYLRQPRFVGAVAPSGRRLAEKMMRSIDFQRAKVLVEYGPGTGVFTRELLRRKRPDAALILIERNPAFCRMLERRFGGQKGANLTIIQGSAEDAEAILNRCGFETADYVVSGLPFSSLPPEVADHIFRATKSILKEGSFITFQYTRMKQRLLEEQFEFQTVLREWRNLPPAYVFVMKKPAA